MAKKNIKKKENQEEPITKCDQSNELVAKCDRLDDVVEISSAEDIDITKLIVVVRDQQVLIDRDIAMLYKVETKVLNQKVKRNVARFPERFRFQLTKQEMKELVTNCDRFKSLKHSSSAPYAFTEQGISMLSAVELGGLQSLSHKLGSNLLNRLLSKGKMQLLHNLWSKYKVNQGDWYLS